jgi:UPF0716 protein FxsA
MRRAGLVAVTLAALAVAEILVFLTMARLLGLAWTLLLVMATSLAGVWLLRREGGRGWRRFQRAVAEGRPPGREATNGLLGLVGALLLVLPGFLTDIVGALLIAPPSRRYALAGVERGAARWISPALVGDLFGPRRVRVRRGPPVASPPPASPATPMSTPVSSPPMSSPPIEGEIIEPDRR